MEALAGSVESLVVQVESFHGVGGELLVSFNLTLDSVRLTCGVWPAPEAKVALLRAEGWPTPSGS